MIRLARPDIDDDDVAAVSAVLRTGFLVQGPAVAAFESQVAVRAGAAHGVAVANCTAALHLALQALDVGPGDRVAVATYSWPATANVIALCGAEPLFVDITPDTWTMDPQRLKAALAADRGVKVVLPVHTFGGMADMPAIAALAAEHGATVVEDAACAFGARLGSRAAGGWGRIGCFSFHPRKSVTTGEGGVLVTDDAAIAARCRALRNHGLDPAASAPDFIVPGYNLRLTEMQGALGLTQLAKLDRLLAHRREVARWYSEALPPLGVTLPVAAASGSHVYQSYVILLPASAASRRAEIISRLREREVETTIGTYHQPLTTWFRGRGGHRVGDFPVTDDIAARALALPMHSSIGRSEVEVVARELGMALKEVA